jgi:uncharacterized protein (TIGR00725 family)
VKDMPSLKTIIIGVMGGGSVSEEVQKTAYHLGSLIASQGWILLNGGRNCGIMEASARGAMNNGGLTVGILPDSDYEHVSEYIGIPILTGMGNARNCINILSSHFIIACPGGAGTLSEIALAIKNRKPLILLNFDSRDLIDKYKNNDTLFFADTPEQTIEIIKNLIKKSRL